MRARRVLYILACLLTSSACAKTPSQQIDAQTIRIASTSLCGDSYVLSAIPQHISALSWQSRDPLSRASADQRALPQARDDVETLLALAPTHIIYGPGEGVKSKAMLEAQGIKTLALEWGEDFETVTQNSAALKHMFGQDYSLDLPLPFDLNKTSRPSVLYLSRSGGTAGAGTFVDAAISAAGGQNFITQGGWLPAEPESLVNAQPDLIITSYFTDGYESAQSSGLRHSSLQKLMARTPSIDIAGALWPCAGPGLYEATHLIADAIGALE